MNRRGRMIAALIFATAHPFSFEIALGATKKATATVTESAPYQGVVEVNVEGSRLRLENQPALYPKMNSGVFTLTPSMYYELKGDRSTVRIPANGTYYFLARSFGESVDPSQLFKLYKSEPKKKKYRQVKISKNAFGQGMQLDVDQNSLPLRFEDRPNSVLRIYPQQKLSPGEYVFIGSGQAYAFGID